MKHVLLKWHDAASMDDSGWHSPEFVAKHLTLGICQTSGWILHEDEYSIIMVTSLSDDGHLVSGETVIPRGCIIARDEL